MKPTKTLTACALLLVFLAGCGGPEVTSGLASVAATTTAPTTAPTAGPSSSLLSAEQSTVSPSVGSPSTAERTSTAHLTCLSAAAISTAMGASYIENPTMESTYVAPPSSTDASQLSCIYDAAPGDNLDVVLSKPFPAAEFSAEVSAELSTQFSSTPTESAVSGVGDSADFATGKFATVEGTGSLLCVRAGSLMIEMAALAVTKAQLEQVAIAVISLNQ